MRNLGNVVGNVDDLRSQREARKNPPQYEAGQGSDEDWSFFEDEGSSGGMDESAFMGSSSDFSFGSSDFNALGSGSMMTQEQMAKNMTSQEDKIIDAVVAIFKSLFGWSKDLGKGIKFGFENSDSFFWAVYGKRLLYSGFTISVVGVVLFILSLFTKIFSGSFWVIIGGLLLVIEGLVIFSFNYDKDNQVQDSRENFVAPEENDEFIDNVDWGSFENDDCDEDEEVQDDFSSWNFNDEYEEEVYEEEAPIEGIYEGDIDIDEAIESIHEIPAHTQTRQYLFEEYSKVLPLKNPEFSKLKPISENSDNFIIFDKMLQDAAIQVGTKEENLPELLELRENGFIIQLKATRPSGLKEDDIANEIANIYSKDEFGGTLQEGVYATTSSVGSSYIINIFKGENSLVTLADTYREVKDFVLDPKVKKPIIIGVNELGRVWKFDAEKTFSYIISGKPRTGKSWVASSLVLQLAMYSSPKEVTFEAFDVKKTSSDFYEMKALLPHFKNFEGDPKKILSRLRYLTTVEAERRRKLLDKHGVLNIADLKAKGIDEELPYVYIIIDEIVGLRGKLTKDENNEFQELVNTIVTQMPNYGFRVILVPHRVTNDVISKTTYTLIGFVACVKSDFKEISTTLEVSKRDFPYSLANVGDMAIKTGEINRNMPVFCHGIAITTTNEGNKGIYKHVGHLWNMLEPEEGIQDRSTIIKKDNSYKGHNLVGAKSVYEDDSFSSSNSDDEEENFWEEVFGESGK